MKYLSLCNETGLIVGEGEEAEILTEEEILKIREQYYAEIKELRAESKLSNEYAYCIMGGFILHNKLLSAVKEKNYKRKFVKFSNISV